MHFQSLTVANHPYLVRSILWNHWGFSRFWQCPCLSCIPCVTSSLWVKCFSGNDTLFTLPVTIHPSVVSSSQSVSWLLSLYSTLQLAISPQQRPSLNLPHPHDCTALHCTVLHCFAVYCNVLHCTMLHCTALYWTVLYYTALHSETSNWNTLYCTVLHLTTLHWSVLHFTALHYTTLYHTNCTAEYCTDLHCTTLKSNTLHCIALQSTALFRWGWCHDITSSSESCPWSGTPHVNDSHKRNWMPTFAWQFSDCWKTTPLVPFVGQH